MLKFRIHILQIFKNKNDTTQIRRVIYLTNRSHVAVRLFSSRSQMTSKCGKNKEVAHEPQAPSVSLMFLAHSDVLCDLLLNRPKATRNLFVKYITRRIVLCLFYAMIRKENRPIHISASYRPTVRGLC